MTSHLHEKNLNEDLKRDQEQRYIHSKDPPLTRWQRLNQFLESKIGFWLLATVLTGLATSAYGYLQIYLDREKIALQKEIEDSRRDIDVIIRIAPMLISNDEKQWQIATIVLSNLVAHRAMDATLALQAGSLLTTVLNDGVKPGATAEEIARSNVVGRTLDTRVTGSVTTAAINPDIGTSPTPGVAPSLPLDSATLPARLYIHIPSEAKRVSGKDAQDKFRAARVIVPGIQLVGQTNSPKQAEIRYCEGRVGDAAFEQVKAVAATLSPPAKMTPLPSSLCTSVRYNHFELWYAREMTG